MAGGVEEGKGEVRAVAKGEHDNIADADVVEVSSDAAVGVMDVGVGEGGASVGVDEAWAVVERWCWAEMVVLGWRKNSKNRGGGAQYILLHA